MNSLNKSIKNTKKLMNFEKYYEDCQEVKKFKKQYKKLLDKNK